MNMIQKMKGVTKLSLALVAAATLLTGCGDKNDMEEFYNEELTQMMNSQPQRPNWDGAAPLYYINDGFADGSCEIRVGVGLPYGKRGEDLGANILDMATGYHCADAGRQTQVVTYSAKDREFRVYIWTNKWRDNGRHEPRWNDKYAMEYAREALIGVFSGKPWTLSGGSSATSNAVFGDKVHPVSPNWSRKEALDLISRINSRYE